jgi:suppressor of G2 allele of SKP1
MNRAPTVQSVPPSYPSSSKKAKDWNKLEVEIKQEEKEEKPEGDAALNQ